MNRRVTLTLLSALLAMMPVLMAQGPPQGAPVAPVDGRQGVPGGGAPGGGPGGGRGGPGRGPAVPSGPGRSVNPFETPIVANEGVITVRLSEFASLPDANNQAA